MQTPTLSLVLPLRDEANEVKDLETHLSSWLSASEIDCEIILVDDGSTDDTRAHLDAWASRDARVKVIGLLRSTTLEGALRAGLDHATGQAIVLLDGDIQDSAEVIPRLIEQWRAGNDLVHARRRRTKVDRGGKGWLIRFVHELADSITQNGVPQDAGDFRLVDRGLAERLDKLTPSARNLRGLLGHVARRQAHVSFESIPSKRNGGRRVGRELDAAMDSVARHSLLPMRMAFVAAAVLFGVSVLALVVMLLVALVRTAPIRGWLWLSVILGMVSSLHLFFIGLVGEYVGRMFRDVQHLPPYTLAGADAIRERRTPEAPRLTMPSEDLGSAEIEAITDAPQPGMTTLPFGSAPPPAVTEAAAVGVNTLPFGSVPPVTAASITAPSATPPPVTTSPVRSAPPPRVTPAPGQVRAVNVRGTTRLTTDLNEPPKTEPKKQETVRIDPEMKNATRQSNPPLPSRRSSIPPRDDKSDKKLDAKAEGDKKLDAKVEEAGPNSTSDRPPPSFVSNASGVSSQRTKTLAGIPLPAMVDFANSRSKSEPPKAAGSALASNATSAEDVDRLKEQPKGLNTLHGVPSSKP